MNAPVSLPGQRTSNSQKKDVSLRLEQLLVLEAEVRKCKSLSHLQFLISNETRKFLEVRQVFVHSGNPLKPGWRIEKVSSVSSVDRNAPVMRMLQENITAVVSSEWRKQKAQTAVEINISSNQ